MWNKVTTCVHNLLGGQRWVDQYGEMQIRNGGISCKLTFKKVKEKNIFFTLSVNLTVILCVCQWYSVIFQANQFSSRRHEVYGQILSPEGKVVHNLFGKWNEALYFGHAPSSRCVWRPGKVGGIIVRGEGRWSYGVFGSVLLNECMTPFMQCVDDGVSPIF